MAEAILSDADSPRRAGDPWLLLKLWAYARQHWLLVLGALAMSLVATGVEIASPYIIKMAIDQYLTGRSFPLAAAEAEALAKGLVRLALLYLALILIAFIFNYLQTYALQYVGQKAMYHLRMEVFWRLQHLPLAYFDHNPAGRLVTRVTNDIDALNEMYTSVLVYAFRDLFLVMGTMAVMLQLSVGLAGRALLCLPILIAVTALYQFYARRAYRLVRAKLAALNASLQENLSGIKLVQAYMRQEHSFQKFSQANQEYYQAGMQELLTFAIFRPGVDFINSLIVAFLVWSGGHDILAGTITFGLLYAMINYVRQFFYPISDLAEKFSIVQSALAAAERVFKLLEEPEEAEGEEAPASRPSPALITQAAPDAGQGRATAPAPTSGPATSPSATADAGSVASPGLVIGAGSAPAKSPASPASSALVSAPAKISFNRVWFAYNQDEWVLKDVSFSVWPLETVAIVGATGAGKTSLISLMDRFYEPQRGSIAIDGVDIRFLPKRELRRRIGLVLQDNLLFADDALTNIRLGNWEISEERAIHAAQAVGADRFWSAPAHSLSAGQKQLLALARILAFDPEIVVLDEATANLDPETEAQVHAALRRTTSQRTTIIIAHRLSTVRVANRIIVMHQGQVAEQGTHQELLAARGLYFHLWQLQSLD